MGYKPKSDSYLMSMTKSEIIAELRVAEHNFFAMEEALNNSAKAGMEIIEKYVKAKELLRMAVNCMNDGGCTKNCNECVNLSGHHCNDYSNFKWKYTDKVLELINN